MPPRASGAEADFEAAYGATTHNVYGMCAMRHMHDYGTTSEQLAWIKVAASHHAQYNEHAMLRDVVTVEDVLNSPMIADPLHRMDCCVVTDGGGALIVVHAGDRQEPEAAAGAHDRPRRGDEGAARRQGSSISPIPPAAWSGPRAFAEAGVTPADIKYASIYDSFTITVLMQLEDLGFCKKGEGGKFVADGNLISGVGKLPFNTDGGGLCNNHPVNRGGMTKIIEAVRQLRGRGASEGAGAQLRSRDRPRHRRTARRAPRRGRGRDLHLQPDAQIRDRALRDRLRHLKEGPSLQTNFVDCDMDKLKIGQKVKVVFKPTDGAPLPFFTPV
jgi:acetyl-CoA C-acetyltransferase